MPRLLEQVTLRYPDHAPEGLHSDVVVRVRVETDGTVSDVEILEGPGIFAEEALRAARLLVFAPARTATHAVPATTTVRLHFKPPANGPEPEVSVEIVVHAIDADANSTRSRRTLTQEELDEAAGEDLADTVATVAGVTTSKGMSDTSKPIIRGFTERRLLILRDGVRHESQKWGPDHAPEIDAFSAGSIGVVRGAAGARYGPDAIGGVLLVDPPSMRDEPGVEGRAHLGGATNGLASHTALRLDGVADALPGWTARLQGSYTRSQTKRAPDYLLGNTASRGWTGGLGLRRTFNRTKIRANLHRYHHTGGVFFGVQNSTPNEFVEQLENEVPVNSDLWEQTDDIQRPFQQVDHDTATLHVDHRHQNGAKTGLIYAFQRNSRREFATVRGNITGPQFDFLLRTHTLDGSHRTRTHHVGAAHLTSGVGGQLNFQENIYDGLPLIANYRSFSAGGFGFSRVSWARVDVEVGVRHDRVRRTAFIDTLDYQRHERRGNVDDTSCDANRTPVRCPADYGVSSASAGAIWHAIPNTLDLKIDLSSATRVPNVDELYLIGSSPSLPVYAAGTPDLGPETTWGVSPTIGLELPWIEAEASAFANLVDDYIHFAPELNSNGEARFDVTIRGTFPSYGYFPIRAFFHGAEGRVDLGPFAPVGVTLQGSLVRAVDTETDAFLVGTPPDEATATLTFRPPPLSALREPRLSATVHAVAEQSRTDPALDVAPAPAGFALLSARIGFKVPVGSRRVSVGLSGHNLLNARYREYTSLTRYYSDLPGRDFRVQLSTPI